MPVQTPSRQPVSSPIRDRLRGALLAAAAAMPVAAAESRGLYVRTDETGRRWFLRHPALPH